MYANSSMVHEHDRPVDPWTLLTGGSVAIVAGLGADLLRLGVHAAKRALAALSRRWRGVTRDGHGFGLCGGCRH